MTLGYRRFMFPGTLEDWRSGQWKQFPISDYFNPEVSWVLPSLLMMIPVLIPPIYYPMIFWPREEVRRETGERSLPIEKWNLVLHVGKVYFYTIALGSLLILFYLNFVADEAMIDYLKQDTVLGYHAPLGGFLITEFVFILISWWVYFIYPSRSSWDFRSSLKEF
eukprot:TRINITY_DN4730_c0_g1_i1.p1 TRINITY_DN4730_c0_g1~~TRINITY_DN4730_c0_g1_i1.p1  ORF type:complete len:165 (-),score=12.29 TRINITY_DN4730_c0_g1_i1:254-748(-)